MQKQFDFKLNYLPTIENRNTDELLEIISNPNEWNEDAVILAQNELRKRGLDSERQLFLKEITEKANNKRSSIKGNASYPFWYLLFIFLFPFLAFRRPFDNNESVISLENSGYYKKSKQRFLFMLFGILMWIIIIKYFIY